MKRIFSALLLAFILAFTAGTTVPVAASTAYVLNTNTKKFHRPECSSVDQMKAKNRQDTTLSYDEIVSKGYSPCQRCNPSRDVRSQSTGEASGAALKTSVKSGAAAAASTGQNGGTKELTYVVNTNTGKFHYPSCASASEIKGKNRMDSSKSREQLMQEGYVPCKRCNP